MVFFVRGGGGVSYAKGVLLFFHYMSFIIERSLNAAKLIRKTFNKPREARKQRVCG